MAGRHSKAAPAAPAALLSIELVALDDVREAPRNPKLHSASVRGSIERFGFADPLLRDGRTGMLVAGHGRLEALRAVRAAGQAPPSGVVLNAAGDWLVPVTRGWASRSDAEAEAFLVAHNQSTIAGGWDDAALGAMLRDLAGVVPDLGDLPLGFDDASLAGLLAEPAALPGPEAEDPGPGEPPAAPVSRRGEVYALGPHRLLCGDSTDAAAVAGLCDGRDVGMILTDPPYCSGGYQEAGKRKGSVGRDSEHRPIVNDRLSSRGYVALLREAMLCVDARAAYVFTDWRMWPFLVDVLESCSYGVRSLLVWDKGSAGMGQGWRGQHELIAFGARDQGDLGWSGNSGNVLRFQRQENELHATQKPVELLRALLAPLERLPIYDPFAGSGTTLIAAGPRPVRAVEIEPGYCDVIRRRWGGYARSAGLDPGAGAL